MSGDLIAEARRQIEICNACRYCEGYCAVFPAITRERAFAEGDITQLANLCHNCRGCHYACQYTEPHAFDLNLPQVLGEVRQRSWEDLAFPRGLGGLFQRRAGPLIALFVISFAAFIWLASAFRPESGQGFYAILSHGMMVAIFSPAFLLPIAAIGLSLRRYWRQVGGGRVRLVDLVEAGRLAADMRNLDGGHGEGCNFEDGDRFSNARRYAHQLTLFGFLLCFLSTASATILHYGFGLEAPYGLFSLPKLFGVPGGLMLCAGTLWLALLKRRADPHLAEQGVQGAQAAFVLLLFVVSATGLLLYAAAGTALITILLTLHLASVLTFFLLMPYTKMAHGFFRMAALTLEASRRSNQN